ncbi:energy-coupling factor transporter transmembrane component T family protein, partial [Paenibacillus turpanensis]|uniref:energy-coupling factor transporter transmembrane component T family protein n=1 Tax=Paenibacillus turpanensis TaxID=2689078 RepID=UPI00140D7CD5
GAAAALAGAGAEGAAPAVAGTSAEGAAAALAGAGAESAAPAVARAGAEGAAAAVAGASAECAAAEASRRAQFIQSLDPRAQWIFYMLFSAGILIQNDWLGLAAGAVATALLGFAVHIPVHPRIPFVIPFSVLIVISCLLSGLHIGAKGSLSFDDVPALETLFRLLPILLVMAVGGWYAAASSFTKVNKALQQTLAFFSRFKLPVEAISLSASLLLRFLPLIIKETKRFVRIAKARGKDAFTGKRIRLRHLPAMLIPMIISLLQLASEISLALQARGYNQVTSVPLVRSKLRMSRNDWLVAAAGITVFAAFYAIRML